MQKRFEVKIEELPEQIDTNTYMCGSSLGSLRRACGMCSVTANVLLSSTLTQLSFGSQALIERYAA